MNCSSSRNNHHRLTAAFPLLLAFFALLAAGLPIHGASRSPVRAQKGMVVSVSPIASDVGVEVLRKGGNAVDAAVAVGFALAVVHPAAGNIGGGGFMVIHEAESGTEVTVDFREKAPLAATADMYLDGDGEIVEGLSTVGYKASGVPGSVAGLHLAWQKAGSLEWQDVLAPAIQLAEEGFPVSYSLSRSLENAAPLLSRFPESHRIFLRNGDYYREGEILRQPELADSLRLVAREGPEAFYRGRIAIRIAAAMEANGGLITSRDLAEYEAVLRDPVRGTYRGHEVISMGPPSSGGVVLLQMLRMIERFPVRALGLNSSPFIHLKAEVMRRAFADRAEYLGDPDFGEIPVPGLLSGDYLEKRSASIRGDWATVSRFVGAGEPPAEESTETTHYSVVDEQGNGVAVTTTINGSYGSGVTIPGCGFLMNNEMDDFSSRPGVSNMFGLIQGEANAIGPGKRPLSAMTPTLVKRDGRLYMVLGSPGGPTIINTVFQILLNVIDFNLDIQEAVDEVRVHHQWLPDQLVVERNGLPRDVLRNLEDHGHQIQTRSRMGDAHSILIEPETRIRLGAPDSRSDSKASGY